MGGSAFKRAAAPGQPTLHTPRMSPAEYNNLKDVYLNKISAYFTDSNAQVAVLREAPEKLDYGDIDIFIGYDGQVDASDLANAVGATALICLSTGDVQIYALGVPKDGTPSTSSTVTYHNVHSKGDGGDNSPSPVDATPEAYAQIDINIIPTHLVDWHIFYSAYGDLNGLLGHIVTNLGFTVTDQGLWLRMKELDAAKTVERCGVADADGMIFLSRDPHQVMRFLGLSVAKWDAGFSTLEAFYEWLGECRLIHPVAIKLRRDKAHERVREQKRDVYRRFFFEWLPKRMPEMNATFEEEEQTGQIQQLRQKYLDEALEFFDKRALYAEKHDAVVLTVNNAIAANLFRPLIARHSGAQAKKLVELVRAFRRFVEFDEDGTPCVAELAHTDEGSQLHRFLGETATELKDETVAEEFVAANWLKLKEAERQRAKGG